MVAAVVETIGAAAGPGVAAHRVAELVVHHLAVDLVGLSVQQRPGQPQRLAASDAALLDLDQTGSQHGASPRRLELREGDVVTVDDIGSDDRWPPWGAAAETLGLCSAAFVGLPPMRGRPVLLELYSRRPAAFPEADLGRVLRVGRLVGLALRAADRSANLADGMHTRGVIGQAQGILMERYGMTGDQAMSYLRRHSQDSHLKVRDLAAQVVGRRELESRGHPDVPLD